MTGLVSRAFAAVSAAGGIRPEELASAGQIGASVWVIASLSVIAMTLVLPAAQ